MDPKVILEAAVHREEISAIEALMLMQEGDAIRAEIFKTADVLNRRAHGGRVTFVRSRQINYTNICRAECSFCSFYRKKNAKGAFVLRPADVVRQIRESNGLRQITLQGGLNPDLTLAFHISMLRAIKSEFPEIHIQAYSPSEIHLIARRARTSTGDVLRRLREAGLASLSGDSADILNDKIRKKLAPDKIRTNDWIDVIRTAHRIGLTTTATMLFGHLEDEIHISEHLDIIKHIQRDTGGFTAFEPIPFVAARTDVSRLKRFKPMTQDRILLVVALSRIFYGKTIRNITVDWTKYGIETAVKALDVGANDIGPISVDASEIRTNGKLSLPVSQIQAAIRATGRVPVEREPYTSKSLPFRVRRQELILV
jgi:cyclic dehypoxanthinyl futalosine synthase